MAKRKLVFIGGVGRTSSTLLSVLLSQAKGCFNLGQIRDVPMGMEKDAPCTCGVPLTRCLFWSAVCTAAFGQDPREALRAQDTAAAALREATANPRLWLRDPAVLAQHQAFVDTTYPLYDASFRTSGCDTLIDSSKSIEIVLMLSGREDLDIYLLHLIRDPRDVAESWHKTGKDRAKFTRLWKQRNRQAAALAPWFGSRYKLVRYEDFATAPRTVVGEIESWAGIGPSPTFIDERTARVSWDDQHLFPPANAGTRSSQSDTITIDLRQDRRKMSFWGRVVASGLSFPDSVKLGYPIW